MKQPPNYSQVPKYQLPAIPQWTQVHRPLWINELIRKWMYSHGQVEAPLRERFKFPSLCGNVLARTYCFKSEMKDGELVTWHLDTKILVDAWRSLYAY